MVTDMKDKAVPCSIYNPQDPETEGKVMERHRCVLIEWLLEVATEEKYRRFVLNAKRTLSLNTSQNNVPPGNKLTGPLHVPPRNHSEKPAADTGHFLPLPRRQDGRSHASGHLSTRGIL